LDFVESGYLYYSCKLFSFEIDEYEISVISGGLGFDALKGVYKSFSSINQF
jgi:hypothetical protein